MTICDTNLCLLVEHVRRSCGIVSVLFVLSGASAKSFAQSSSANVQPQALGLLRKNRDAMLVLKGYRAECRMIQKNVEDNAAKAAFRYSYGILVAAKPNLMRYDSWDLKQSPEETNWKRPTVQTSRTFVSDGKRQWLQFGRSFHMKDDTTPKSLSTILEPWQGFFAPENSIYGEVVESQKAKQYVSVRQAGTESVDGVLCDKIVVVNRLEYNGVPNEIRKTIFLRRDGLVRRQVLEFSSKGTLRYVQRADLNRIEKNPDLRRMKYVYTPPKNVVVQVPPKEQLLLADGALAPDFEFVDKEGKPAKLSELRGKIVVVDFWASWCGPCLNSMPHTQEVAARLQKEGLPVVVLAVDDGESREAFSAWVTTKGNSYPALRFVYSPQSTNVSGKLYLVTGIPTQYVIDPNGVVRSSLIGYGGPTDEQEKAVRAARI